MTVAGSLLDGYRAALASVHGHAAVADALADEVAPQGPVHVLALGKAAEAMLAGAAAVWSERIACALVVPPAGASPDAGSRGLVVERRPGNHPVPGAESLAAGHAVARFLGRIANDDTLLVLLSGGASALAELPRPNVDLPMLRELNTRLLAAGLDIRVMNALRGRFSKLKAGGAAGLCPASDIRVLFISDVPGDAPASVGSGPFWAPESTVPWEDVPDIGWPELQSLLERTEAPRPAERRPVHRLVAGNADARRAVARASAEAGRQAWDHGLFPALSGAALAAHLVRFLRGAPAGVHVWGGEAPVRLPEQAGRGGRAQHLAALILLLWMARGWPRPIELLSAATDGMDGNSGSAGAWFGDRCPDTAAGVRARLRRALRSADTAALWESLGQTVPGAETGTNVMDLLVVGLGPPSGDARRDREASSRPSGVHATVLKPSEMAAPGGQAGLDGTPDATG